MEWISTLSPPGTRITHTMSRKDAGAGRRDKLVAAVKSGRVDIGEWAC